MRYVADPAALSPAAAGLPFELREGRRAPGRVSGRLLLVAGIVLGSTGAVALSRDPILIGVWLGIWALALRFGWKTTRSSLPFFFWFSYMFFYPQVATVNTVLLEKATLDSVVSVLVAVFSGAAIAFGARRSPWFWVSAVLWVLWGLVAYGPMLMAWLFTPAGSVSAATQSLRVTTSGLKTALPVLLAWVSVAAALAAIERPRDIDRFVRCVLLATLVMTTLSFLQAASGTIWIETSYVPQFGRLYGVTFPDANGYARLLLVPALLLLAPLMIADRSSDRPAGLWVALALALVSLALTFSRTTYVSFTVGAITLVLLNLKGRRTAWVASVISVLVFAAALGLGVTTRFGENQERRSLDNLQTRADLYGFAWEVIQESPWVGLRPGGTLDALQERNELLRGSGQLLAVGSLHNMFLGLAVEWGTPMAVALLLALAGTLMNGVKALGALRRVRAGPGRAAARALATTTIAVTVAYIVHGFSENVPYEQVFFALGLSMAVRFSVIPTLLGEQGAPTAPVRQLVSGPMAGARMRDGFRANVWRRA
jgi:O-antigen ligase